MTNINGYVFDEYDRHPGEAAYWAKAKKGENYYYLREFKEPKRPTPRVSEAVRARKTKACDSFAAERQRILDTLKTLVGGNIIAPVEYFEHEGRFYQATEWREISKENVSAYTQAEKELILKTATLNLKVIHDKKLIHLDLMPSHMPVIVDPISKKKVSALMDFDASHFEGAMPPPKEAVGTDPYKSPEFAAYCLQDSRYGNVVTTKNDIFALAIVFHEYWTGRRFIFKGSDDRENGRYLYQAVDNNEEIRVAPGVPDWLERLLRQMIKKNPDERPTAAEILEWLNDHSKIL